MSTVIIKLNNIKNKIKQCRVDRFGLCCDINIKQNNPPKQTENTFTWKGNTQNKYEYNYNRWQNKIREIQSNLVKKENQINILNKKMLDIIYSDEKLTADYLELEWE